MPGLQQVFSSWIDAPFPLLTGWNPGFCFYFRDVIPDSLKQKESAPSGYADRVVA